MTYLQRISIVKIDVETLEAQPMLTVRMYSSDSEAWDLGHQLWDTWMRANPLVPTRLVVGRRRTSADE